MKLVSKLEKKKMGLKVKCDSELMSDSKVFQKQSQPFSFAGVFATNSSKSFQCRADERAQCPFIIKRLTLCIVSLKKKRKTKRSLFDHRTPTRTAQDDERPSDNNKSEPPLNTTFWL